MIPQPYVPQPNTIAAQFVLGRAFSSRCIAWFGGGGLSHVDIVMPDGQLLGARSDRLMHIQPGVQIRPPFYDGDNGWSKRIVMAKTVTPKHLAKCYELARSQLYKAYDHTAIWGFATGRDWRDTDKWFCSELLMWMLETADVVHPLIIPANKIFPGEALALCSEAGFKPVVGQEFL